jgi:hypothetical protein
MVPPRRSAKTVLRREQGRSGPVSTKRLDKLIEEATVDCHDDSEQITGLHTMLEEHLDLPFKTKVLGVDVTVERVELTETEDILAICARGQIRQAISLLRLPLPRPLPRGAEWIEAYRRWARAR